MPFAMFTYKLKAGITPEMYESWLTSFDYPHVEQITSVKSLTVTRVDGMVFGGGEKPYDYFEVIEFDDLDAYIHDLKTNPAAHAIGSQVGMYVTVTSNVYGFSIPPGVHR